MVIFIALLASALRLATPLIFSALGGIFSERSGVVNIAIEGIMINGAFFAILVTKFTDSPWLGVLAAMVAGALTALLLAVLAIHLRGNQVVAGVAINLFATSITAFLLEMVWKRSGQTDAVAHALTGNPLTFLEKIPVLGELFAGLTPFVYLAFVAVAITYYVIYKTPFGLRIRAVGEHPRAADTVGINVYKIRYICVMISGVLAGISGASLSLGTVSLFREGMTSGKGFIAIAAMIFGKWHPIGAMLASLFFGFAEAVQIQASSLGINNIPSEFLQTLPYIATILVLSGFIGRAVAPKADGIPYEKGHR
ncbi:MAG: ral nucleoside transport system permease protein [Clostridiales bacterium]|jgi:simple sugar transport system permease protein|nr:ral nucleoside transport system permease protein [Clostridiales bacterium]MDN5299090.1 ral nucleoside transport system permease protein [Clostridiales bacterium]